MSRPKDINSPSSWNMRIWDTKNSEWLCNNNSDALPYYGFDIRGGEVTAFQGIDWIYKQIKRWNDFVWERSTGLKDKNGKEIYEGDILREQGLLSPTYVMWDDVYVQYITKIIKTDNTVSSYFYFDQMNASSSEVIGNVHENPEL